MSPHINYFTMTDCLFGAVKLTRNSIKRRFIYKKNSTVFDGAESLSFGKELARNGAIFDADNSSSRHSHKRNVLKLLDERPTNYINVNAGEAEK